MIIFRTIYFAIIEIRPKSQCTESQILNTFRNMDHLGIVKKCAVEENPKSEIDRNQAAW
jgi:hypothetical protein